MFHASMHHFLALMQYDDQPLDSLDVAIGYLLEYIVIPQRYIVIYIYLLEYLLEYIVYIVIPQR